MADLMPKKKKKKKHSPLKDWLSYLALRIFIVFLSLFDIETNLNTACFLGRLLWKHYHRGRKRALDNLRASFPERSEKWIWQTGRRFFFKQKTAYEIMPSLVGSEMCIRDRD